MFLSTSYAVRNLVVLDLSQNLIGDEGFKSVASASYLSNLDKLFLNDNLLTSVSAKYLKDSPYFGKLR